MDSILTMSGNAINFLKSFIYAGSDFNQRSFEDESWNSLQSTVLAGHLSFNDSHRGSVTSSVFTEDDEDRFNANLDAIYSSESDVFFDLFYDFEHPSLLSMRDEEEESFPSTMPETDSGITDIQDETNESMLHQMFQDMEKHSTHSTPSTHSSRSHDTQPEEAGLQENQVRKTIFFLEDEPKFSMGAFPKQPSPTLMNAPHRVSEIKRLFEKSQRSMRSPTFHTQQRLKIAKARKTTFIKSPRKRPSSCSDYQATFRSNSSANKSRSSSVGDSTASGTDSSQMSIVKSLHSAYSRYKDFRSLHLTPGVQACGNFSNESNQRSAGAVKRKIQSTSLQVHDKSLRGKKVSAIMNRKSMCFISSPVKPVNEIRKFFSPSSKSDDSCALRKSTALNLSRKSSASSQYKSISRIPRLIIDRT